MTKEEAISVLKDIVDNNIDVSYKWVEAARIAIMTLEQSKIIRCQDCKYCHQITYMGRHWYCGIWQYAVLPEGFCHRAEE